MPRVIIRTDGNTQIGLGHLTRCIALSHMLKNDFEIVFACKHIPEQVEAETMKSGFQVRRINNDKELFHHINTEDIVVLDGYSFDVSYQKEIKAHGNMLVVIDDLHDQQYYADLIINQAPSATETEYIAQNYTRYSLGVDYALLRPSFLAAAAANKEDHNMENLLICFGGADPKNLTEKVLKVVVNDVRFKKITVVTGCAYAFSDTLNEILARFSHVEHYSCLDESAMIQVIKKAGIAIVPASGILFEILAVGCKAISGMYMDNQRIIYHQFLNKGLIIDAGNFQEANVQTALNSAVRESVNKRRPIDGRSGKRILKLFKAMHYQCRSSMRRATAEDLELTYGWATDESVRRFSFQKHKITREEHERWFTRKLNDVNCLYYIFLIDKDEAGSIRFDIKDGSATISYLLDPGYHGQGLGSMLVEEGEKCLRNDIVNLSLPVRTLVGLVEESNIPSLKIFNHLGYRQVNDQGSLKFEKELVL